MTDQRTRWTMAAVGIVVAAVSGVGYVVARSSQPPPIVISGPPADPPPPISGGPSSSASTSSSPTTAITLTSGAAVSGAASAAPAPAANAAASSTASTAPIAVDVSGAVHHPTMYYLAPGSRVQQAIHAAGGPTSDADLDQINLAEKLTDGEKIYIPHRGHDRPALNQYIPRHGRTVAPDTLMPVPPAPVAIPQYVATQPGSTAGEVTPPSSTETGKRTSRSRSSGSNKLRSPADGQIDLNSATAEDLQRLPGVGPAMSARIIAYREQNGPFHSVDDLRQVSGIGDKKLARWSPFLVIH